MMSTKSFIRKTEELQACSTIMTLLIFLEDVKVINLALLGCVSRAPNGR
ncbi:MAG: hypothetical protein ACK552_14325 [Microcystis sp.]